VSDTAFQDLTIWTGLGTIFLRPIMKVAFDIPLCFAVLPFMWYLGQDRVEKCTFSGLGNEVYKAHFHRPLQNEKGSGNHQGSGKIAPEESPFCADIS
jgi:hypothetical protein